MKINLVVEKCDNPGIVFAIRDALVAAGFKAIDAGFGMGPLAGHCDVIVEPPIDFIDSVPDAILPFAMGNPPPTPAAE